MSSTRMNWTMAITLRAFQRTLSGAPSVWVTLGVSSPCSVMGSRYPTMRTVSVLLVANSVFMGDTPGRMLKLLSLLQSRRSWGGAELAERLEVTERTVRRDAERLRMLG